MRTRNVNPETMRAKVLAGLDRILSAPWIVQQFETTDDKRMLHASRDFWEQATTADLTSLITLYERQP